MPQIKQETASGAPSNTAALVAAIGLLVAAVLGGCERSRSTGSGATKEALASKENGPVRLVAPVIVQQKAMTARDSYRYTWIEGKVYNPNSQSVANVVLRWTVFEAEEFPKIPDAKLVCEERFNLIPPLAILDFKTNRIIVRSAENGFPEGKRTDLTPTITFEGTGEGSR